MEKHLQTSLMFLVLHRKPWHDQHRTFLTEPTVSFRRFSTFLHCIHLHVVQPRVNIFFIMNRYKDGRPAYLQWSCNGADIDRRRSWVTHRRTHLIFRGAFVLLFQSARPRKQIRCPTMCHEPRSISPPLHGHIASMPAWLDIID